MNAAPTPAPAETVEGAICARCGQRLRFRRTGKCVPCHRITSRRKHQRVATLPDASNVPRLCACGEPIPDAGYWCSPACAAEQKREIAERMAEALCGQGVSVSALCREIRAVKTKRATP